MSPLARFVFVDSDKRQGPLKRQAQRADLGINAYSCATRRHIAMTFGNSQICSNIIAYCGQCGITATLCG